jgi:hypothetical protein
MTHEKKIENILEPKLSGIYEFHSEFLYTVWVTEFGPTSNGYRVT